jgi:uncharacterized protein (TIGR04255 family)
VITVAKRAKPVTSPVAKRTYPPLYLEHSPLIYFIAQVRFAEILSLSQHVPAIQDQLRRIGLPLFKQAAIQSVNVEIGHAPTLETREIWFFESLDSTEGVIVTRDSVSFQTTKYRTYETTIPRFIDALSRIHELVRIDVLQRCGLRYVDVVNPQGRDSLTKYLNPEILGLSGTDFGVSPNVQSSTFSGASECGTLVVKFSTETFPAVMPPDLVSVTLPVDMPIESGSKVGVLDFDHYLQTKEAFSIGRAVETLNALHDAIDRAFRSCVTETALSRWGKRDV